MVQLSASRWAIKTRKSTAHTLYGFVWCVVPFYLSFLSLRFPPPPTNIPSPFDCVQAT